MGGNTVSVSENVLKLVTSKEFKAKGKVVNLEKYDKYKEKERFGENFFWRAGSGIIQKPIF